MLKVIIKISFLLSVSGMLLSCSKDNDTLVKGSDSVVVTTPVFDINGINDTYAEQYGEKNNNEPESI